MNKPHKHAEVIKAWANGKIIQYRETPHDTWRETQYISGELPPAFTSTIEYRVKPEKKTGWVKIFRSKLNAEIFCSPFARSLEEKNKIDLSYGHHQYWSITSDWIEVEYEDV